MSRHTLWIASFVAGMVVLGNSNASAQHYGHGSGYSHGTQHQDLNHNEFHRQQYHAYQHQFPQSQSQHFGLHQDLNHDRYHDSLRHDSYHSYRPSYYGNGGLRFGISRQGLSLRFGR